MELKENKNEENKRGIYNSSPYCQHMANGCSKKRQGDKQQDKHPEGAK